MKSTIFVILLVSLVGISTAAVQCYQCLYYDGQPGSNGDCLESEPGYKYAESCPSAIATTDYCRKIEAKVNDKTIIYRDCYSSKSAEDLADQCPKLKEEFKHEFRGVKFTIPKGTMDCYCRADKCNGAQTFNSGLSLTILTLAFLTISRFF